MLRIIRFLFGSLITINLCSCSTLSLKEVSTKIGSTSLKEDISKLFAKYEVVDLNIECHTDATSREGICFFDDSSKLANRLVRKLNLRDFKSEDIEHDYKTYWLHYIASREQYDNGDYKCGSFSAFHDLKFVKVYGVWKRSPELQLGNGQAFSKLFLYHRTDTDRVCVQVTYSYG